MREWLRRSTRIRLAVKIILVVLFFLGMEALYPFPDRESTHIIGVGEVAEKDIIAPFTFKVLKSNDELALEQEKAMASVPAHLFLDTLVFRSLEAKIGLLREYIESPDSAPVPPLDSLTLDILRRNKGNMLLDSAYTSALSLLKQGITAYRDSIPTLGNPKLLIRADSGYIESSIDQIMDLEDIKRLLQAKVGRMTGESPAYRSAMLEVLLYLISPNLKVDFELTQAKRREAASGVSPEKKIVLKGEKIIGKHEVVTEATYEKLKALEAERKGGKPPKRLVWFRLILFAVFMGLSVLYAVTFKLRKVFRLSSLIVLVFTGLMTLLVTSLVMRSGAFLPYCMVIPFFSVIVNILVGPQVAVFLTAILAMIIGVYAGRDFTVFAYSVIVGWSSILMSRQMRSRYQIYFVSASVLVVGFVVSLTMTFLKYGEIGSVIALLEANFLTALASGLLVLGVLPVFERAFRVSTDFLLLELSNLNNPILLELSKKAPGTFTHSILLGNLCEAAARAIGANPLLARVGAYYHDIGKMKRPEYFIENQRGKQNPHEKLSPRMSALILASHIKDGVEMARAHNLPNEIIEIIASHHGTSLMRFFYNKAKEEGTSVREDEFRYPGPKPRSKEAAILMIADAAEATARSQGNITSSRMKSIVRETIEERLADGQFDDTDLTRRDLLAIAEAIYPILVGVFHPRIEYTKGKKSENHQRPDKNTPEEGDSGSPPKANPESP